MRMFLPVFYTINMGFCTLQTNYINYNPQSTYSISIERHKICFGSFFKLFIPQNMLFVFKIVKIKFIQIRSYQK